MKNLFPIIGLCLFLIATTLANGGVPPINVTVSDASGKATFKGATKADGGFTTAKLQPGNYVVQFTAKGAGMKGGQYSVVVAAGKKKVVANALAGEKFSGAGIAVKLEVGAGLSIVGIVSPGPVAANPTQSRDSLGKLQDRGQDSHQDGFHAPQGQTPDKMYRP
jgi:hypothetical protein